MRGGLGHGHKRHLEAIYGLNKVEEKRQGVLYDTTLIAEDIKAKKMKTVFGVSDAIS